MPVYVYFIGCVDIVTKTLTSIKIGKSENPNIRLTQLQSGNPGDLVILKMIPCETNEEALKLENFFHNTYKTDRLNGEWFSISSELLTDIYMNESDTNIPPEIKQNTRRQSVAHRVLEIIRNDQNLSAKQIRNRMKWAELHEVELAIELLLRIEDIEQTRPKRTLLYATKGYNSEPLKETD